MSEVRVWICQCLCPQRHAILAVSGEADSEASAEELRLKCEAAVEGMLDAGLLNPWCGLCKAERDTWRFELGRTRWRTMAEAEKPLRESEAEQAAVRRLFGDSP
jgi:hypothetical protein